MQVLCYVSVGYALWAWRGWGRRLQQCVGVFCLGALVSGQSWVERVPPNLARRCGIAVATTVVVGPLVAVGAGVVNFSGTA